MARVALRRILAILNQTDQPETLPFALDGRTFAALTSLAFVGTRTVARLLRDKRAISGEAADGISGAIATALEELGTLWGLEL